MMIRLTLFAVLLLGLASCRNGRRIDVDTSEIRLDPVVIKRYDLDLFSVRPDHLREDLLKLESGYPWFLGDIRNDTSGLPEMRRYLLNPRNIEFFEAVKRQYSDLTGLENGLTEAFRHLRFYIPGLTLPSVVTYISGGDYEAPVQSGDGILLIGLDNYLDGFETYKTDGLPLYLIRYMEEGQILPGCMKLMSRVAFPERMPGNNLLDFMIEAGKRLWFTEAMLPDLPENRIIAYDEPQHRWIVRNERNVWAAIIENRMLYATDGRTIRTLMADGPFTAEFSKESPARLGEWIGWQIVRSFMEKNPDITLHQLMAEEDSQKILSMSGYRPLR